ncbi:P2Y purinoceptor 3 [Clarias gariepinus]|uniref:P2Y purinoceptor 3 n=1 Tax=Clarias gariepinus TaxID=13013 RepID=UPI00234D9777|nr:P2Y purinoceptor 3 [Clarias gariepinus]
MVTQTPTGLSETDQEGDTLSHFLANSSAAASCINDESYKYIFLPICYCFTFVFSISLNFVVLYRSFRRTKQWNVSLIYMVNLATTDFMYGLSLPFLVASYIMHDNWVFGDFMCRLVRFLFYFNLYCSIFFLTCISMHRYLGICHPMRTITLETKRAVKGTCIFVWLAVFALTCPIFRFAQTELLPRRKDGGALEVHKVNGDTHKYNTSSGTEMFHNCWDDAIDKEFQDYVPYGITLHLLGFFVPFSIIAWCYSRVVMTIFQTLHSQHPDNGPRTRQGSKAGTGGEGMCIILGAHSPYINRRRKSIKTIITITLLFALCFFPFHVTRTIFLVLKVTSRVQCHTMRMVSICYKITRPLASFNAWLNALLYFLTKEKSGLCCNKSPPSQRGRFWPLRMLGKGGNEEEEAEKAVNHKNNDFKTEHNIFPDVP